MKYLITGANGMMGSVLNQILRNKGFETVLTDVNAPNMESLDVTNFESGFSLIKKINPDVVIHLAALTDMDLCQSNPDLASKINAEGTKNIVKICSKLACELVYVSTGAVFDGNKDTPYIETDKVNPLNVYGRTKLEGELFVRDNLKNYFIFRVGWLIGGFEKDKKFVGKILELINTKKELYVVNDRYGSPTCVEDFSDSMISIVEQKLYGLYHMVNKGWCSRFDMAKLILDFMNRDDINLHPIKNKDYPSITPRARTEAMINYKLNERKMDNMATWQDALFNYLNKLTRKKMLDPVIRPK